MSICAYWVSAPGCHGFPDGYGGGVSITKFRFLSVFGLNLKLSSIPHILLISSSRRGFQLVDSSLLGGAAFAGAIARFCSPWFSKTRFTPHQRVFRLDAATTPFSLRQSDSDASGISRRWRG